MILHARKPRFNGHPFMAGSQPRCTCGGRGQCIVCESTHAVRFSDLKRGAAEGGEDTVGEFFANETLDKPFPVGKAASLPYIRMVGRALGIKEMENASPDDLSSPVITRISNLGGMIAAALSKMPVAKREVALEEIGGIAWTQSVLRMASGIGDRLTARDAVHFSLTLHFLMGYLEAKQGQPTINAAAYAKAFNLADRGQQQGRAQSLGVIRRAPYRSGFSGFGAGVLGPFFSPPPPSGAIASTVAASGTGTTATTSATTSATSATRTGTRLPISTGASDAAAVAAGVPIASTLKPGELLTKADPRFPGAWLRVSPSGMIVMFVSSYGEFLVARKTSGPPLRSTSDVTEGDILRNGSSAPGKLYQYLWSSKSHGVASLVSASMGTDGVFRLSGLGDRTLFALPNDRDFPGQVSPIAGSTMKVLDDGNVICTAPDGTVTFTLNTSNDRLPIAQGLFPGPADIERTPSVLDEIANATGRCFPTPVLMRVEGIQVAFTRVFGRAPNTAEIRYYGLIPWCINRDGLLDGKKSTLEEVMETVKGKMLNGLVRSTTPAPDEFVDKGPQSDVGLQQISDAALQTILAWLDQASNWTTDILCKGFKALFPAAVADVLCSIFQFVVRGVAGMVGTATAVVLNVLQAVAELVNGFVTGNPKQGVLNFFKSLTRAIFQLVATTYIVPFLTDTDPNNKAAVTEAVLKIQAMADAATEKDPLFPLTLTITIISAVVAPTPQTALQVAIVMVPVVAAVMAPAVQKLPVLKDAAVEVVQKGIDTFLRLSIMVAMGIVAVKDTADSIFKSMANKMEKEGPFAVIVCNMAGNIPQDPLDKTPPQAKTPMWCLTQVLKRLTRGLDPNNPQSITAAIKKFKLDNIANAAISILTIIPAILLVLGGGAIESDPTLKQSIDRWFAVANASPGMLTNKDVVEVTAAAKSLIDMLGPDDRAALVAEQQRNMDRDNSAKMVAEALWTRVGKDGISEADRTAYFTSLRQAWVAQGGVV